MRIRDSSIGRRSARELEVKVLSQKKVFERGPSRKRYEVVQGFSHFATLRRFAKVQNKGSDAGFPRLNKKPHKKASVGMRDKEGKKMNLNGG
jgi:hypothetical protein